MGAGSLRIPGRSAPADFQCLGIPGKSGSGGRFGPESLVSRDSGAENPGYPVFFSCRGRRRQVPAAPRQCPTRRAPRPPCRRPPRPPLPWTTVVHAAAAAAVVASGGLPLRLPRTRSATAAAEVATTAAAAAATVSRSDDNDGVEVAAATALCLWRSGGRRCAADATRWVVPGCGARRPAQSSPRSAGRVRHLYWQTAPGRGRARPFRLCSCLMRRSDQGCRLANPTLLRPFSQKSRTATVPKVFQIGLYDPAEAESERLQLLQCGIFRRMAVQATLTGSNRTGGARSGSCDFRIGDAASAPPMSKHTTAWCEPQSGLNGCAVGAVVFFFLRR